MRRSLAFITVLLLTACATLAPPAEPPAPPRVGKPVVLALMQDADRALAASRYDTAASTLERALRIEPRNASLWHRLANVRYRQQRYEQAIQLASKSNTLARDGRLIAANWRLIGDAYEKTGDSAKALNARRRAQSY